MPIARRRGAPAIYYEERGAPNAPPLLLIRGLGRGLAHWGPLAHHLEGDFRLLLFDNRGIGKSEHVRRPYGTPTMARDAVAVLDAAGVERAHVFGMSLGGMVAQRVAIEHPERLERLVLGCTTPGYRSGARARFTSLLPLLHGRLKSAEEACRVEARYLLSDRFIAERPDVIEHWIALAREQPVSPTSMILQVGAATRHEASEALGGVSARTLVLCAREDPLIPPENSRRLLRLIHDAELAWLDGPRHDFTTEAPERVARMICSFLLND